MGKKQETYNKIRKWCDVCQNYSTQIVETTASFCTKCETTFGEDGDELFGKVDEVVE